MAAIPAASDGSAARIVVTSLEATILSVTLRHAKPCLTPTKGEQRGSGGVSRETIYYFGGPDCAARVIQQFRSDSISSRITSRRKRASGTWGCCVAGRSWGR